MTSLFQDFVPEDFVRDMDFSTLELLSASHVTRELRQRHNDIIWRVRWKDTHCYLYLLMEFQSTVDPFMAVRVLVYSGLLWEHLIDSGEIKRGDRLPPIFPLVIYRGRDAWRAPKDIASLLASMPQGLKVYQPAQQFFLIDELALPERVVSEAQSPAGDLIRLERVVETDQIFPALRQASTALRHYPEPVKEKFYSWLLHIFQQKFKTEVSEQTIRDIMEDSTMFEETCGRLADSWLQKGVIQGRAEGWKDGRAEGWEDGKVERTREVAQNLLHLGLPIAQIAEATGLSTAEIEALRKVQ